MLRYILVTTSVMYTLFLTILPEEQRRAIKKDFSIVLLFVMVPPISSGTTTKKVCPHFISLLESFHPHKIVVSGWYNGDAPADLD